MPKGFLFLLLALIPTAVTLSSLESSYPEEADRTPSSPEYYYEKGREQYLLLAPPALHNALGYYDKSLEIDESFVPSRAAAAEAYSFLAYLSMEEKEEYEELFTIAYESALKALRLDPNSYLAHRALALNYLHLRRKHDSKQEAAKALELNPDDPESICILWEASGANPDSPLIKRALDINPNLVMAHLGLGKSYLYKKRDYAKSAFHFGEAARLSPRFDFAHTNLGTALRTQGKMAGAVAAYQRAIEINPMNAAAYMNLGIAQLYMGNVTASIPNEWRAISLNPKMPDTYYYLGRGYELQGNYALAKWLYVKFLEFTSKRDRYALMAEEARKKLDVLNGGALRSAP